MDGEVRHWRTPTFLVSGDGPSVSIRRSFAAVLESGADPHKN
jgi:hypothetical protein